MLRKIRKNYRRVVAFMLTMAMTFTNIGTNLNVAFAAGEDVDALFLVDGSDLEEAIQDAVESGDTFAVSSLELTAKTKSLKNSYEKLIGGKKGAAYQLDVDVDDSYAPEGTSVEVFYNAGTEEVVFLFINESDLVVRFRANVDGYETAGVTINPNAANVDDSEASYVEDYSSTTMIDDTSKKISGEVLNPTTEVAEENTEAEEQTEAAETEETEAAAETSAEEDVSSEETAEGTEESSAEETAETVEETEETSVEETAEAETEEAAAEAETEAAVEEETEAAEETEAPAEEEEIPEEGAAVASISLHKIQQVASNVTVLDDDADIVIETEEVPLAEEPEITEDSSVEIADEAEAEEDTEAETEAAPETEEAADVAEETSGDELADVEMEAADETDEASAEETAEAGTEEGTEAAAEETAAADEIAEETAPVATDSNADADHTSTKVDDEQLLEDDITENALKVLGDLDGKAFNTVTIWGSANARAFKVALDDLGGIVIGNTGEIQEFTASTDDVKLTINAPEGALPEGATVQVESVDADVVAEAVMEELYAAGMQIMAIEAVDITFYDENGEVTQPDSAVEVVFEGQAAEADMPVDQALIYHVDEDGNAEVVATASSSNETIAFEAEHFSIYARVLVANVENGIMTLEAADYTVTIGNSISIEGQNTWNSSNHSWKIDGAAATITNGRNSARVTVKGVSAGTVVMTHTWREGWPITRTETFTVQVVEPLPPTEVVISGTDTLEQFASAQLTATMRPEGSSGSLVWSSSDDHILTVSETGEITGVSKGTAVVTVSVQGLDVSGTHEVTVTAPQSTDQAAFYYLKTPTSDPASNDTKQWGDTIGNGKVNVTGAIWAKDNSGQDKNVFSPDSERIISWPVDFAGGVVPRSSEHWGIIFNAFKSTVTEITLTEDDVENIILHPYKISKNNGTNPDMHVDCTVEIQVKGIYTATYYLWDAGDTAYIWKAAENVVEGKTTSPLTPVNDLPATKTLNGRTYRLISWYDNESLSGSSVSFPYTMYSNKNFYAKYVENYFVNYDLDGGSWSSTTYEYAKDEGDTVYVVNEVPTKTGYDFVGWSYSENPSTIYHAKDSFVMPAKDVILTAVYELRADLSYTVNYLEKDTNKVLSEARVVSNQTFGTSVTEKAIDIVGYAKVLPTEKTITIREEGNEFTFYYTKRTDLEYSVEYYYAGVKDETKTVTETATYQDVITTYEDKNITGYKLEKTENLPLTVSEDPESNVIKVYYIKDEFGYTVEYYYDGVKDSNKTETLSAMYQDVIDTYEDKNITGYKLEKTENLPLTVSAESGNNVIKVYYVKDAFNYTVEYYYDGVRDDKKTEILSATYQDVIENYTNKIITGYKLEKTENRPLTVSEIEANNVIRVYYVKNTFRYTVEYYYDGVKNYSKTEILEATYQDVIDTYTDKNITGYKFEKTENLPLTISAESENNVIKVYYVKDEFGYTVEYYYDGVKDSSKTETLSATYQDVIDTYTDKNITGYKLEKTENLPLTISAEPENNVIKVYYVKDEFGYTVEYYYDGVKDSSKTETLSATYQDVIKTYTDKSITGYKFEKTEYLPLIVSEIATNNTIKVYYVKDNFKYSVEYYYDDILGDVPEGAETGGEAEFKSTQNVTPSKSVKMCEDTYTLVSKDHSVVITADENQNIIKVYYEKDNIGPGGPDDVPDKYQVEVTYQVVHGQWDDGTEADITEVVTLVNEDENWAEDGTYRLKVNDVPGAGNRPADGYKAGAWKPVPVNATISKDSNKIFVYTYIEADPVNIYYVSANVDQGTVSPANEAVKPVTGVASGSNAIPKPGYHFEKWTLKSILRIFEGDTVSESAELTTEEVDAVAKVNGVYKETTFEAHFAEDPEIKIEYVSADVNKGTVSRENETMPPATGKADGSVAQPKAGYKLIKWTNEAGETVSTDEKFVPQKINGVNVAATYTAHFAERGDLKYEVHYFYENGDKVIENKDAAKYVEDATFGAEIPYVKNATSFDGHTYVFVKTEGPTKVSADSDKNILNVYYSLDEIAETDPEDPGKTPDGPDGIPDKYQITFTYVSEDTNKGTVGGTVKEVHTIYDVNVGADGSITAGNIKKAVSPNASVTVTAGNRYYFKQWTSGTATYANVAELKAASFDTDMVFTAGFNRRSSGGSNSPSGGSGSGPKGGGSSTSGPGVPTTTIDPDAVPLASLPTDNSEILSMIDDEDVPLAALPKTGQSGSASLMLMLSSMMLAAFAVVTRKKEDKQ